MRRPVKRAGRNASKIKGAERDEGIAARRGVAVEDSTGAAIVWLRLAEAADAAVAAAAAVTTVAAVAAVASDTTVAAVAAVAVVAAVTAVAAGDGPEGQAAR